MDTRSRIVYTSILTLTAWSFFAPAASAYVDPGSTSFVFQAIIAFAMAAGLTLKTFWRRIKGVFTPQGERTRAPEQEES